VITQLKFKNISENFEEYMNGIKLKVFGCSLLCKSESSTP